MAKKPQTSTETSALAVSSNPKLTTAYDTICEKLKGLEVIHESVYKTNKQIQLGSGTVTIDQETSVEKLTEAIGKLSSLEQSYNKGQEVLGEPVKVFKHNGYTVEEYVADAKLRIQILKSKEKYDKLQAAKNQLTQFLTTEDKLNLVLADLQNI